MKKWIVRTGDGEHTVEYRRSFFGIVHVTIDGDSFRLGFVSRFKERNEPFRVGDEQCMLMIKRGGKAEVSAAGCEIERVKVNT
jgi:hypothetical protein